MAICPARPNVVQPVISGGGSFTPPPVLPQVDTAEVVEKPVVDIDKPAGVVLPPVVDKSVEKVVEVKTPTPQNEDGEADVKPEVPAVAGGVGNDELPSPGSAVDKKLKAPNKK